MTKDKARPTLEQILRRHGGRGVDSSPHPNFLDSRVIDYLRNHGREFSTIGLVMYPLRPGECHWNVSDSSLITEPGYRIGHGFALGDDGLWYPHSWGIRGGNVVETCPLKGEGRAKYFGFEFPVGAQLNTLFGRFGDELERLGLNDQS
jgi:hypothetical protein